MKHAVELPDDNEARREIADRHCKDRAGGRHRIDEEAVRVHNVRRRDHPVGAEHDHDGNCARGAAEAPCIARLAELVHVEVAPAALALDAVIGVAIATRTVRGPRRFVTLAAIAVDMP